MNAAHVKDALRRRHPFHADSPSLPGQWTCLEEWHNIDLIAFSAWANGGVRGCRYPVVGYEVKVSRSDYKRDLHDPTKRAGAVAFCNEFYFAVPSGLLKSGEIAWDAPDWTWEDFQRKPCPAGCVRRGRGQRVVAVENGTVQYVPGGQTWPTYDYVPCETCGGKGTVAPSEAEIEAPVHLWVPPDVGLIVVNEGGRSKIEKPAPIRKDARGPGGKALADLIRWASFRPDPRHTGERERFAA